MKISTLLNEGKTVFENMELEIDTDISGLSFRNCKCTCCEKTMKDCTFENCDVSWRFSATDCTFTNCDCHTDDGVVNNCKIMSPRSFISDCATVTACQFSDIELDGEGEEYCSLLGGEDCKFFDCSFNNARLRGGAYLICCVADSSVSHCTFTNCYTDREDLEIVQCWDYSGKIKKKIKNYDITDSACKGLDEVKPL